MTTNECFIGIDVGLTSAKAAAFGTDGSEILTVAMPNPREASRGGRQEIDMAALWRVVAQVLRELTAGLAARGYVPSAVGATGHGNGLYLVDDDLRPVRAAIASNDNRAESIVARLDAATIAREHRVTGSMPWAGQPAVLLAWLAQNEPESVDRATWVLSCKDWITTNLTGAPSADLSDASACGLVDLEHRSYAPSTLDNLGLSRALREKFPPLSASGDVVGAVTASAASSTGLPLGIPVVAGCMDCVASPLGAGSTNPSDVTIIVGTWAINSVVVPADAAPPRVTLNALLPDPRYMLAQEVAPTSAASIEWFASMMSSTSIDGLSPRDLLHAASTVPAGADGLLFLPFINGAPDHLGASGTFIGAQAHHGYREFARAVAEGITQYHRVQLEKLQSTAAVTDAPWTLAGGGAKNPVWAQMFADVIGHPVRRQLGTELGARGVASLAAGAAGLDVSRWISDPDPALVVRPGTDRLSYLTQNRRFDAALAALDSVWTAAAS
ncbi:carbohydrate kinase [Herbiconiux moechotypicola]|uniref:FGGY-family carbohydrate kinase n=1 Tax=Herbiconiux moechotypicola TaxID=637393 RepID=A0ABN3DDB8_9MICO|nr:FGGY-family carbohydrate kinase [Herbiconiux moechotypicola]MCS5729148.1 carbohydrate kinase [Herbiconiux moechotypicola]